MKTPAFIAALLFFMLVFAGIAKGDDDLHPMPVDYSTFPALNDLGSFWAQRPAVIGCGPSTDEWESDPQSAGTWGYAWLDVDWAGISPGLCEAALNLNTEDAWEQAHAALGILVITHEAWHLRWWYWRADEGRVECKAIRNFKRSARMLGADEGTVDWLYSWAWAYHVREIVKFPEYGFKGCKAPKPSPAAWARIRLLEQPRPH